MSTDLLAPDATLEPALRGEILDLVDYRQRHSLAETASRVHQRVVAIAGNVGRLSTELGCWLWQVREYKLYEPLGYPHFNAYLDSPEIGMSRGHLYKLVAIAEAFCPALRQPPSSESPGEVEMLVDPADLGLVGVRRAYTIAHHVQEHPEEADEWVHRAKALTDTDLQLALLENADPGITQIRSAAFELGSKLVGIAHHLKGTRQDPLPILDELIAEAQRGRDWLLTVQANKPAISPQSSSGPI